MRSRQQRGLFAEQKSLSDCAAQSSISGVALRACANTPTHMTSQVRVHVFKTYTHEPFAVQALLCTLPGAKQHMLVQVCETNVLFHWTTLTCSTLADSRATLT